MFKCEDKNSDSFPEILELAPQIEVLQILECPVCKQVPFPPVFNCLKGHIICNSCKPKLNHCALCMSSFSDGRNFAVESIVLSSKHTCKYKDNGCSVIMTGSLMMDHIKNCQFKGLLAVCHLGRYTNCKYKEVFVPLKNYLDHLKEAHMMLRSITKSPKIVFDAHVLTDVSDTFWLGDYVVHESKIFVVRQFMKNNVVYFSLAVIGSEKVAMKYLTDIKIVSETDKFSKVSWTVPVHSVTKTEEEIQERFCGVTPFSYFKAHCKLFSTLRGKEKISISVEYIIRKNESGLGFIHKNFN